MSEDCIFCKIVSGEVPSEKVYEDENAIAFLDIAPINLGHTLVITKKHARNFLEMSDDEAVALAKTVKKVATAVKQAAKAGGLVISTNVERPAGQIIYHVHFHLIPRHENDGLHTWPKQDFSDEDVKGVAGKIRDALTHN